MRVADLARVMEEIAPARFAASWDNVGLLVGDQEASLSKVLLTIDFTREVLAEALREQCDAVVSYHPPVFAAQKRFVAGSVAFAAARAGVAVHSPHTALDAADGGTNDVLADALGLAQRAPLAPMAPVDPGVKLVTFVPASHVDALSAALFAAGAGEIGKYTSCSFRTAGTGTFLGGEGTNPAIGQAGRLEEAPEVRLEVVVPEARVAAAVHALRAAHPYEEAAFDLLRLAAPPPGESAPGMGRVGDVGRVTVVSLVERLKAGLGLGHVLFAGDPQRRVSRVAVCAGSGGELVPDAIAARVELFVTGELRHHDVLRARAAGMDIVCTLHSASERPALVGLERRLAERLPGVAILRSAADREPLVFA
jgi:dinuclear metal center YbgI/SA1388 family protein